MTKPREIFFNTVAQVGGKIAVALLAVVSVKILTGFFGRAGYGQYATIFEFLAFFGAIADLGLFSICVREGSKTNLEKREKIFQNTLTLRAISIFTGMAFAVGAAFLIPNFRESWIAGGMLAAAVGVGAQIAAGTVSAILQIEMKMGRFAGALVFGKIISTFLIFAIAKFWFLVPDEKSFIAAIWAATAGSIATFLLAAIFAGKFAPLKFKFEKKLAGKILREAAPFGFALILGTIYFKLDIILFSFLLPSSVGEFCPQKFCAQTEAGSYAVAVRMFEVLILFPIFFSNSLLPLLSKVFAERNRKKLHRILQKSWEIVVAAGAAISVGAAVLAAPIAKLISHEKFLSDPILGEFGADTALQILSVAVFCTFGATFFGFVLIAGGAQKKLLKINFAAVLFNFAANLWAIPKWGLLGAAATSGASEILILIFTSAAVRKISGWKMRAEKIWRIFFAVVLMGISAKI